MKIIRLLSINFLLLSCLLNGQSISTTKHNLSVSGPGTIKATSENQICIFCHTPHNSNPQAPLWNRNDPGTNYTLYNSSTLNANPGQPDGSSILCLSCHDGTIALGNVISRSTDISFGGGVTTMPSGRSNIGTDLSDDHPISFTYNNSLSNSDGELKSPGAISGQVHLENGKMQCISCHDPHKNINGGFLLETRQYSTLCLSCHEKANWNNSRHKNSNKTWNGSGVNPWPNSNYTTVAENACENCHTSHNAGGHVRLRNSGFEENNCLNCHNGNVAAKNIETELNKTYSHDVYNFTNIHDPNEISNPVNNMHVECVDCHNPHQASGSDPFRGVVGVDGSGNTVSSASSEYQVCYKCHSNSSGRPASPTNRLLDENNVMNEFDLSNTSFHPIEGPGKNSNVPSLISPYTLSSVIKCSDCHASNGNGAPAGPHGSIYPQILKYNFNRNSFVNESYSNYELCYKCHDRDVILYNTQVYPKKFGDDVHRKHIRGEDASCNICHDPHGSDNSHLINFDLSVVQQNNKGKLEFIDQGTFAGSCSLKCHGKDHDNKNYSGN